MEMIKGQTGTVTFAVPSAVPVTVNVIRRGVTIAPFTVTPETGSKHVDIEMPYVATHDEGTVEVNISFTYQGVTHTSAQTFNVVTPYLPLWELKKILETEDEDMCWLVEAAVRNVINAHCGQEFGLTAEPQRVTGNTEATLSTTRPVVRLDRLTEDGEDRYNIVTSLGAGNFLGRGEYQIIGDGWYIKRPEYNPNSIKADRSPRYSANPIRVGWSDGRFRNDSEYVLYGLFGYPQVPSGVVEAAKLLVNDYACADSLYRDRYLKSMRSADWRIEYAAGAWTATGNARADLLLNQYVVNRIVVI